MDYLFKKKKRRRRSPPIRSLSSGETSNSSNRNKTPQAQPTEKQLKYLENYRQTQPDKLVFVADFLNRTLTRKKPIDALVADFRAHEKTFDLTKMTAYVANPDKNRSADIGCLDKTRVILRLGKQPYIHANYVGPRENPKKFICCQAPLDSTIIDFWTMVAQEGSRCIVMLCNYTENDIARCARYLPSQLNVPQTHGAVTVTSIRSDNFPFKQSTDTVVVRTVVEVTPGPSKRVQVEHLHWQDCQTGPHFIPSVDEAPIELIQYVQQFVGSPIIIHSSAGNGRDGSLLLMDMLLYQLGREIPWPADLMTIVMEMRQLRHNLVRNERHYIYCHMVMVHFLGKQGILSPNMVKANISWMT